MSIGVSVFDSSEEQKLGEAVMAAAGDWGATAPLTAARRVRSARIPDPQGESGTRQATAAVASTRGLMDQPPTRVATNATAGGPTIDPTFDICTTSP